MRLYETNFQKAQRDYFLKRILITFVLTLTIS